MRMLDITVSMTHQSFITGADFSAYVSSLPTSAHPHLIDWDSEGVDRDLNEIALHMLGWEERLCTPLGLTATDIHDIKEEYAKPKLQR